MPRHSPCALYNLIVIRLIFHAFEILNFISAISFLIVSFVTKNSISFLCAIFKELYLKDKSLSKLNREESAFLELSF